MVTKAFYVRDALTTIPAIAIRLWPANEEQRQVFGRAGYGLNVETQSSYVLLFKAAGDGRASSDPFQAHEPGGTMFCAHLWAIQNFNIITDGMNLDVEGFRQAAGRGDYSWQNLSDPPLKAPE